MEARGIRAILILIIAFLIVMAVLASILGLLLFLLPILIIILLLGYGFRAINRLKKEKPKRPGYVDVKYKVKR